jgi:hypothetical protein
MRKALIAAAAGLALVALFAKEYPAMVRELKIMRM